MAVFIVSCGDWVQDIVADNAEHAANLTGGFLNYPERVAVNKEIFKRLQDIDGNVTYVPLKESSS